MKKVLTFGVFDYFHLGHLNLLRQCREHGDYLIVGVQSDEYAAKCKPEALLYTQEERAGMIRALRIVDEVFIYDMLCEDVMESTEFDVLALGEDHIGERFTVIENWCHAHGKEVVRLRRTPGISSSAIREAMKRPEPGKAPAEQDAGGGR